MPTKILLELQLRATRTSWNSLISLERIWEKINMSQKAVNGPQKLDQKKREIIPFKLGRKMSGIQKRYSAQEKTKIVLEILKGELTQSQITAKYGIHSTQLYKASAGRYYL